MKEENQVFEPDQLGYEMAERIKEVISTFCHNTSDFAKRINVPVTTVATMINLGRQPRYDHLCKIITTFGVSPEWLLFGKGTMTPEEKPDNSNELVNMMTRILDQNNRLLQVITKSLESKNKPSVDIEQFVDTL